MMVYLELSQDISILSCESSLGSLKISQVKVGLFNLLVQVIEVVEKVPVGLLSGGLGSVDLISGSSNISNLSKNLDLVLLDPETTTVSVKYFLNYSLLCLHLGQLLNLLIHLHDSVLLLLLHAGGGGLALNVGLLNILPQLGHLSVTLLVQLNLGLRYSCSNTIVSSVFVLTAVAPQASLRRSLRFSASLARSDLCLSALALAWRSALNIINSQTVVNTLKFVVSKYY